MSKLIKLSVEKPAVDYVVKFSDKAKNGFSRKVFSGVLLPDGSFVERAHLMAMSTCTGPVIRRRINEGFLFDDLIKVPIKGLLPLTPAESEVFSEHVAQAIPRVCAGDLGYALERAYINSKWHVMIVIDGLAIPLLVFGDSLGLHIDTTRHRIRKGVPLKYLFQTKRLEVKTISDELVVSGGDILDELYATTGDMTAAKRQGRGRKPVRTKCVRSAEAAIEEIMNSLTVMDALLAGRSEMFPAQVAGPLYMHGREEAIL